MLLPLARARPEPPLGDLSLFSSMPRPPVPGPEELVELTCKLVEVPGGEKPDM